MSDGSKKNSKEDDFSMELYNMFHEAYIKSHAKDYLKREIRKIEGKNAVRRYDNIVTHPISFKPVWRNPKTGKSVMLDDDFLLEDSEEIAVLKTVIQTIEEERDVH